MKSANRDEMLEAFDASEGMQEYFDFENAVHLNCETRKINVDMPCWMIDALDKEAERLSINRQAVIKVLLDRSLRGAA